jgi:hypothetical protein
MNIFSFSMNFFSSEVVPCCTLCLLLFCSGNNLGKSDWQLIMEGLSGCTKLKVINDFPWTKDVLTPNVRVLNLKGCDLQRDSAMTVFIWLLQRAVRTVTVLNLRCEIMFYIAYEDELT